MRAIDNTRQDLVRIERAWAPYLHARGINPSQAELRFLTLLDNAQPCGPGDLQFDESIAWTCGDDAGYHIIIPVKYIARLYDGEYGRGRFRKLPARILLAHEYGHAVQFRLSVQYGLRLPAKFLREQLADCLSGMVIREQYGFDQHLLESRILLRRFQVLGDREGMHSHGTSQERYDAFGFGYNVGIRGVTHCFQKFWPNGIGL